MPGWEAPCVELGSAPQTPSVGPSPSPSEISSSSSLERNIRPTPLFRALAMAPPEPEQPGGQEELERRLPGYRRIVIPRDLTLIELLKQSSGVSTDEEVLTIREAKLRVVAEQVGLRRLHVLAPRLGSLTLDGSAVSSLRDLGIGLVHLKEKFITVNVCHAREFLDQMLSVNRCGLTSLDGVWGLSALRELHAANNKLQDLHPLAALQKLHTLNLTNNPIAESGRLWTLGVCGALRTLVLRGTPMAAGEDYRAQVASALPMLINLDDTPLNGSEEDSLEPELNPPTMSSDSESEGEDTTAASMTPDVPPVEPQPGPSKEIFDFGEAGGDGDAGAPAGGRRRRPATTEGAGARPRAALPPRPRTAHDARPAPPSRLLVLNTLMDEEWRCSGSRLTSRGAVCGNLTRALRRSATTRRQSEEETSVVERGLIEASRSIASEIPRAPTLEDWAKFREETGIDIEIDFNARPKEGDANSAMDRLERIEKETQERLKDEAHAHLWPGSHSDAASVASYELTVSSDCQSWSGPPDGAPDPRLEVDVLFKNNSPSI